MWFLNRNLCQHLLPMRFCIGLMTCYFFPLIKCPNILKLLFWLTRVVTLTPPLPYLAVFFILSWNINGLVQDCSISSADALEILQSCTKPSIYARIACPTLVSRRVYSSWPLFIGAFVAAIIACCVIFLGCCKYYYSAGLHIDLQYIEA